MTKKGDKMVIKNIGKKRGQTNSTNKGIKNCDEKKLQKEQQILTQKKLVESHKVSRRIHIQYIQVYE